MRRLRNGRWEPGREALGKHDIVRYEEERGSSASDVQGHSEVSVVRDCLKILQVPSYDPVYLCPSWQCSTEVQEGAAMYAANEWKHFMCLLDMEKGCEPQTHVGIAVGGVGVDELMQVEGRQCYGLGRAWQPNI